MSEREALLAAVVADPDDPLPRLVFADWLDEHGDPAWAELIRLQNGYFQHWTNAEEMKQREAELIEVVRARYPDPEATHMRLGPPERGFPDAITIMSYIRLDPAFVAEILASYPITWFQLGPEIPDFLIANGTLRRARVIDLHYYGLNYFPDGFLDALDLTVLRGWFWQHHKSLGEREMTVLANAPSLAGLEELYLAQNSISPAGCDALIASPYLTRLEYLDLSGNPVGDAARRLEDRFGAALRLV